MVLLAQINDLHIDGGEERTARAERVMGYLAALPRPVDAVLVTGDVTDHGEAAEYQVARELLGGPAPVLICPGNHDRRASFRRALVAMHHPPLALGVPFVDEIAQAGGDRLAEVVRRHQQVVAVLCGHAHTAASTWFAGRQLLVAPGVASTLLLPAERPTGDVLDGDAPAAIAFHLLDGDRLTTHFRVVG
jgi:Icc protein